MNATPTDRMNLILERLDSRLDQFLGSETPPPPQTEHYHLLFHTSMEPFANKLIAKSQALAPTKTSFTPYTINWDRFNDKTDNIKINNMKSPTHFKGKHVLFIASFHDNDATMSQFHVIAFLCECLVESLTILLPYYSTATMERVDIGSDGVVPTANTLALLFNGLPSVGRPIRVMTYDLHTLQNRFYLTGHAVATLHTAIPLVVEVIEGSARPAGQTPITAIAFPDEGAKKRFGKMFEGVGRMSEANGDIIFCSKVRSGNNRIVSIADGDPKGKHVLIVDDQTKSGGTLIKCAQALKAKGATEVSAYVTHAIMTDEFWSKFVYDRTKTEENRTPPPFGIFSKCYITDSIPVENEIQNATKGRGDKLGGRTLNWTEDNTETGLKTERTAFLHSQQAGFILDKLHVLPLASLVLKDL